MVTFLFCFTERMVFTNRFHIYCQIIWLLIILKGDDLIEKIRSPNPVIAINNFNILVLTPRSCFSGSRPELPLNDLAESYSVTISQPK